jgi:hypothetical protein
MEGFNIHYAYIEKRYALGQQLVTSHLMAGRLSVSVRLELYEHDEGQEGFRSKHTVARCLIEKAIAEGFPFDCVLLILQRREHELHRV